MAAIDRSTIIAYVGNKIGKISAGNIGMTPMITPRGWLAPMGVFWRELKATIQTVTRKTSAIPIANVRIAMLASRVNAVPKKIPVIVLSMIAKTSK